MACVELLSVGRQVLTTSLRHLVGSYESARVFSDPVLLISFAAVMKAFLFERTNLSQSAIIVNEPDEPA